MTLARPTMFSGRTTSKIHRVDPTGLALPVMTVNKVYGINAAGAIELGDASTSILILGFYLGTDPGGFLQFEQERISIPAAFTARGTIWYLSTAGDISIVPSAIQVGIAISADALMITGTIAGSSGISGVDVTDVLGSIADDVQTLHFETDYPDGLAFAKVDELAPGTARVQIDKQENYDLLEALVPTPTGFDFAIASYRAVEVFYLLAIPGPIYETGSIYILHDGVSAVVRVDLLDLTSKGGSPSGVLFSADVSAGQCRLLYTRTGPDAFVLSVKPRAIIGEAGGGGEL